MDFTVINPQAQLAFVKWVQSRFPRLYRGAMEQSGLGMGDFASSISNIFDGIKNTLTEIAPAYLQTRAEYELLKLNIQRARNGETPVNSLEEGRRVATQGSAPAASVMPVWLIPVGIGIVAFMLLRR